MNVECQSTNMTALQCAAMCQRPWKTHPVRHGARAGVTGRALQRRHRQRAAAAAAADDGVQAEGEGVPGNNRGDALVRSDVCRQLGKLRGRLAVPHRALADKQEQVLSLLWEIDDVICQCQSYLNSLD